MVGYTSRVYVKNTNSTADWQNLIIKLKINSIGKENLKKLNNKNPTLIMKYSKYKEPFLPRNFKFIKIPEMIYADDSKINNTIIFK